MTSPWRSRAAALVADLRNVFGDRLRALVAYGPQLDGITRAPLTTLALVSDVTVADLEACAKMSSHWERVDVATPLVLPADEFRRSLDVFPLEYGEIIRAHALVFGNDPFTDVAISKGDLRRACETQVKSHLVHLREGFIECGGKVSAIGELVTASAPAFSALLRNVARLHGVETNDRMEATLAGARAAKLPDGLVSDVLALEQPATIPSLDPARLFPHYLAAVEQLAKTVDTWPV
jgi:hypothetical protein